MAGELWRGVAEVGLESVYGTAVTRTRKVYLLAPGPQITKTRAPFFKKFATGTRDDQRAYTSGPIVVGGPVVVDMSADELIEWLLITLKGAVTPTTPGGATLSRLWTFVPGSTALDSMTLAANDGAQAWIDSGVYGNTITIEGSVTGDNKVTIETFGKDKVTGTLTGGFAERVPDYVLGWQTNLYIDAFGGTPGTTAVVNMVSWRVVIGNNLGRKYLANDTKTLTSVTTGEISVTAELTFEASVTATQTEWTNWDADTKRLVRLEFLGPVDGIETGFRRFVTIDIPGNWTSPDLTGEDAGTRTYKFGMEYVYDPTNTFGLQVRCQNARTAAW